MSETSPLPTLDLQACERARLSRDACFDGLFFIAVRSTGIYCRPVCPAPTAKSENVRFFTTAAAAEVAGFRPCLRCRPELAPGNDIWQRGDHVVTRALKLIESGLLQDHPVDVLAQRVGVGARHLRRLFVERLGAPPMDVHTTRRLLFAKQLLTETRMSVTDVALASGFGSLRRFNAAFAQANHIAPRDLRRHPPAVNDDSLSLRLSYRPPYDFASLLAFLRGRALPGIERVDDDSYCRVFGPAETPGWLRLSAWSDDEYALRLQLHCPQPTQMLTVVTRIRRMFDLDADPQAIGAALQTTPHVKPLFRKRPGLRLPGSWDGFEVAVRAILGQQVSVAAARTLASRIVQRYGKALPVPVGSGLERLFPAPEVLVDADLRSLGITTARAQTIRGVARAVLDGCVDFRVEQSLDEFVLRWVALPGIGEWTAHYMAMRALSHPDAFPAADLILRRAASGDENMLSTRALTTLAEAWRPWRAYAVMHLWRSMSEQPKPAPSSRQKATA
ncbi:DNA-3-methyladenine glycosylase 2 family protein [Dyella sp. M7H15-1]|uniref:DNA-3-methyladenine glycosylase 2 n=1 Tax=Dyella sp. M7H15-1 TaxID=2501295 RepID=UPI0010050D31|nr:DNA-3-methyladenine glycosylase 2 [Dyella sp. M7H15-1]QAU23287.1 DNA-3-methyladenine glycosylase 2 family protein [Dyella sp. M7H15-1]